MQNQDSITASVCWRVALVLALFTGLGADRGVIRADSLDHWEPLNPWPTGNRERASD